jgi:alpha-amylase/alpha-mannosidase (GH57 family)
MSGAPRFPVVLFWHMHQPQYRDPLTGTYVLPWTYLHAIKDYVDMAAHLEAQPRARAVVNFTPVLIEQIEELAARVSAHLTRGEPLPDPLLALLGEAMLPDDPQVRLSLLQACLRAERINMIERYEAYAQLAAQAAEFSKDERVPDISDQLLHDLAVWYHIAWLGETVRRDDPRVAALTGHGREFAAAQRRALLGLIGELLSGVLARYRKLAESGQIELAMSPYGHPLLPLLIDFHSARESIPAAPLPHAERYPGGESRGAWHIQEGLRVFRRVFGHLPIGCWPPEGAISAAALEMLAAHGIRWVASGGNVLRSSLERGGMSEQAGAARELHAWQLPGVNVKLFFRHDELSDLIGFTYSKWHGDDAVGHFVGELERLARTAADRPGTLILVALDGENAWEHYPFNGYYFLHGLYAALADHPQLQLTTLGDVLDGQPPIQPLQRVVAGSWVHGTLATWIGDPDKNAGWDLLVQAKIAADEWLATDRPSPRERIAVERQLAVCEGSDWFWWFGDYNPSQAVSEFERLFRHQLAYLYRLAGREPPASLSRTISLGRGEPEGGGTMRRAHE